MTRRVFLCILLTFLPARILHAADSAHNAVLLEENFDSAHNNAFAAIALKHKNITLIKGTGTDGSNAIRVAYVGTKRGSERVSLRYPLKQKVKQASLSFDVRFAKDFQWTYGGKLHGLGPKHPVTGGKQRQADRWSARITFQKEGRCATYLYDQDRSKKWGVGNISSATVFTKGRWHHVELQLKLNDPHKANGSARIFIDGKPVAVSENIDFRQDYGSSTFIEQLLFSTFHGGSNTKWTPVNDKGEAITVYADFDNFLVTSQIQ
ncbi:hypothetical protein SAMN02745866_00389 [Alteromonadaceae bacterium Bs31]|nr:hypothetical protein SAMN02745866_00389 [Alteromonadaceae bacterium Bs31]